jgi:hypothetical protein
MLAQQEGPSDADVRSREPLLATLAGFLLLGALIYVLHAAYGGSDLDRLEARTRLARAYDNKSGVLTVIGSPEADDELFKEYHRILRLHGLVDLDARVGQVEADLPASGEDLPHLHQAMDKLLALARDAHYRLGAVAPPAGLPLSSFSGPPPTVEPANFRRDESGRLALPAENAAYLGRSLFTDFLLPVELGGTLLLVATVGAIAIAHRHSRPGRLS